jgi:hypothetical protein
VAAVTVRWLGAATRSLVELSERICGLLCRCAFAVTPKGRKAGAPGASSDRADGVDRSCGSRPCRPAPWEGDRSNHGWMMIASVEDPDPIVRRLS